MVKSKDIIIKKIIIMNTKLKRNKLKEPVKMQNYSKCAE